MSQCSLTMYTRTLFYENCVALQLKKNVVYILYDTEERRVRFWTDIYFRIEPSNKFSSFILSI
jgi:hypothetical protein